MSGSPTERVMLNADAIISDMSGKLDGKPDDEAKTINQVLRRLEALIISDEWGNDVKSSGRFEPPRLSDLTRSIVTSYSLKAYVDLLSQEHKQRVADWLYNSVNTTLQQLFRFDNCETHVDVDGYEGGVKHACQLALEGRFGEELREMGYDSFTKCSPVVYLSPALRMHNVPAMLRLQCGIKHVVTAPRIDGPLSAIEGRIDHTALDSRMAADMEGGARPLLVVATVGSPVFGQNDLISKLLELREKHSFWLHVVGNGLAALATTHPPDHLVKILQKCDSMSLALGEWLGVSPLSSITLHRRLENHTQTYFNKMAVLPLWVALNCITPQRVYSAFDAQFLLNKTMAQELCRFEHIHIVGVPNAAEYADKVQRGVIMAPCVLVFKYNVENDDTIDEEYLDCLNSWIGQGLLTDCTHMGLHFIELGRGLGTALRFCPLETASSYETTPEHIRHFSKQLTDVLAIVNATVRARRQLPALIAEQTPALRLMRVAKWAGAGAVSYVPAIVDTTTEWTETQQQQVSHLNLELVHSLRSSDSAFSTGESVEGVSCVKFGMLADERDLLDLVRLVAQRGHDIEQSSQYLESLAELVRQGIHAANDELRRESDNKLMQEGVMRQLPMFGSLLNWWSPMSSDHSHITGRSFDLKTGSIKSTRVSVSVDGAPATAHTTLSQTTISEEESSQTTEENNNHKPLSNGQPA